MKRRGMITLVLFALITFVVLVGINSVSLPAWSADSTRQPVQKSVTPQPAAKRTAPWQPVSPHKTRFDQNHTRIKALVRDIEPMLDITPAARTRKVQNDETVKLNRTLSDLKADLRELLREVTAASSLMREAAMADRSGSIAQNKGDQLVNGLERKISALERKGSELTTDINMMETQMNTMTDMSQQLQLQLQDAMNKLNQAMQILSNIMKNQHDTLKAIIRNMK